jgi:Rod binding domain-containing protein
MTIQSSTTSGIDQSLASPLKNGRLPGGDARKAAIHKVAVEFQSLFVEMMLKSMRDTVKQDQLTGGGHGEEVYGSLLDREYAMAVSRRGGFGLAEMIEKQLLAQERGSDKVSKGGTEIASNGKTTKSRTIEGSHENQ